MPFIDARELPGDSEIVADLVVIGAGMAGIAIAREWAGSDRTVAFIESGGRDFDAATQDLCKGEAVISGPDNADRPFSDHLYQGRRRQLGGSGMIWGGKCVALDPADFAKRDWISRSGWPVTRRQMQPYYDRASDLLGVPHFPPGETSLQEPARPELPTEGGGRIFSAPRHYSRMSAVNDPEGFDRFRTAPFEAPNITVWLHANVTEIKLAQDGRAIERLDIACLNGRRHAARGRAYVLAAGGIENARLLLASNGAEKAGVGNRADLVGRFFQGHMTYGVTDAQQGLMSGVYVTRARDLSLYTSGFDNKSHCVLAPTLAAQRQGRLGNATFTLGRIAPNQRPPVRPEVSAISAVASGVDGAAPAEGEQLYGFFMSEHFPNPDSRITLGSGADALGMPRIRLAWRYTAAEWRSLEGQVAAFARELATAGVGRVCFPMERPQFVALANASRHHMGTTRMHADPAEGVVDANSRVHGVSNLYVAGSSVFPTSGIGNPTLTLLAMTMRLSDHLRLHLRRAA
ncbi:GMC family oxidoreductase [Phenylobacterium sp.]|jgi:choline dehydrogenase-like flavoprotein|uniref:GMC family oxidoreductase n=1 Tax=Phenylobacterium sp. TaxID=1871053 RepID=UPI002F953188